MQNPIFIELHDRYDYSHKIMISVFAIETVESYRVNLREHGYDVAETYEDIKQLIEIVNKSWESE